MAETRKTYSKKQFEYHLTQIRTTNDLGYWENFTNKKQQENPARKIWEYVYAMQTYDKSLKILIYSSIDITTDKTREIGSDAIRVVYRRQTQDGGIQYAKIQTHYRTENLPENLKDTLLNASKNYNKLSSYHWTKVEED